MHLSSRAAVKVFAVAALPLALTACSFGASASAKVKDPNAGLLTGTQLKKSLAPTSALPSGLVPVSGGSPDSGGQFMSPSARSAAKPDCTKFESTSWLEVSGFKGGVSFAQGDAADKKHTEEVAQEIDEFQGTTATKVMNDVRAAAAKCPTFTDAAEHAQVKLAGHSTAGLGDEAYTLTLTSPHWQSGSTLIAARTGNAVVTVLSTAGSDNGAAVAQKVTEQIVGSLKTKKGAKAAG